MGEQWHIILVLLAGCTTLDIFADVRGQTGPPEFHCNKLTSFQVPRMAGGCMIMEMLKDGMAEGVIIGDINATLVSEDTSFDLPVGKAGAEWERDVLVQ